jgi:mannose-1-phosphate guanylyltransferase
MRAFTIVMAGGSGTRFWPLSRKDRPKQLLALAGTDESLLAATVRRAERISAKEDMLVVTSERLAALTRNELASLPAQNILAEPLARNTAPCIGWACARIARTDPDALCAVLPADHHVRDEDAFARALTRALEAAAEGDIVTIGIHPDRPETGYGYIEMGETMSQGVYRARRFVEKPNRQRAVQFLAAGTFLWNSGMFFFRASAMLDAIRSHLPGLGAAVDRILKAEDEAQAVREAYPSMPEVSIDHGVMEKVSEVAVVPADFGWSDLGSFHAAHELSALDENENSLPAGAIALESRGCYVRAPAGKIVALVGVSDLVVVDTEDAILILPRDRAQEVKQVVEILKKRGDEDHL